MIRDIVLGIIPPAVFTNPVYAWCQCLLPALFSLFFISRENCFRGTGVRPTIKIMLAMGLCRAWDFTVVGVNTGIRQGYMDNVFLLVFLGTITE